MDNGIKLLDLKIPDWMEEIKLPNLNILSCVDCVIGQTMGVFSEDNLNFLGLSSLNDSDYEHGFVAGDCDLDRDLEREWTKRILNRELEVSR